jgi:hypothetical protein
MSMRLREDVFAQAHRPRSHPSGGLVRLTALPARRVVKAGLVACALAATALYALTPHGAAAVHPSASARNVPQRPIGTATVSKKTLVNLGVLAAAAQHRASGARAVAGTRALSAGGAVRSGSQPAARLASAAQVDAAAGVAPTVDKSFNGVGEATEGTSPPDPNAAAGLTQIVEVVNVRLAVYTRSGAPDTCGSTPLNAFFGSPAGEGLTDPRVIYDNVANKFTAIAAVVTQAPSGPGPHLPGFPIIRIAHSLTGDACGTWSKYSLDSISLDGTNDIVDGGFVDQPAIGQDRDAFLFAGAATNATRTALDKFVVFAEPKSCAYSTTPGFCSFKIFSTAHYAAPASAGGNPMITSPTRASYFVASVKNVGYELYRMDNSGFNADTTLTLQATVGLAAKVQPLAHNAGQPATPTAIGLAAGSPLDLDTRIKSTPTFDGTRIWFTHTTSVSNHATVRYGAINISDNTEIDGLALHSATSDDFNPSIAVAVNGASRTIFLNWAYTDRPAGIPVTDAVAAITVNSTDSPPPINGKDLKLITGGITADTRFGDYSSTTIDPRNTSQVCAVTAQQYFDQTSGIWATRIGRFGAAGC